MSNKWQISFKRVVESPDWYFASPGFQWQAEKPSSSSVVATARCGLWPVEKYPSIFSYLSPTLF
jgi:hypothetical protein